MELKEFPRCNVAEFFFYYFLYFNNPLNEYEHLFKKLLEVCFVQLLQQLFTSPAFKHVRYAFTLAQSVSTTLKLKLIWKEEKKTKLKNYFFFANWLLEIFPSVKLLSIVLLLPGRCNHLFWCQHWRTISGNYFQYNYSHKEGAFYVLWFVALSSMETLLSIFLVSFTY